MDDLKQIGKYELRDYLGGGMSHVYKAWDPVMNRTVVVKIMTQEATGDADAKARFLREAQTAGALSHDNVIRVYDYGDEQGRPYMVMEHLEGQDLSDAIKSGAAGDLRRRLEIARESAKALAYIHSQSIIHRDIKPENIHLDHTGRVRLMDFGIAKRPEFNLTRTGFTLGTPYYMAPEQVRGDNVAHTADIYAFGILLYELLIGQRPFTGEKIEQLFYKIMNEPVDPAPLRAAGVPDSVCDLIVRCTAKNAADRPQSLTEALPILDAALGQPIQPPPSAAPTLPATPVPVVTPAPSPGPSDGGSNANTKWLIGAGSLAVVAALVVYFVFIGPTPSPVEPEPVPTPPSLTETIATPQGDMVLVPAGEFLFGSDRTPTSLAPYYIDKTEVTNAAWAAYCADQGKDLPPDFPENRPELPVVNITHAEARDFARWAGKRLPTAQEWEKAARGSDGRPYPWGAEADPTRANVGDNPAQSAAEVLPAESFAFGASPYQVLQMAGNVWELVDEPVTPSAGALEVFADLITPKPTADEPWYTIRGGSFDVPLIPNVTSEWTSLPARYRQINIGFRCVKDVN